MPLAPIVNTALGGDAAGRAWSLLLDGGDVLKEFGAPGNRYGVPRDSITVTEAGPGGVSRMSFAIDDPLLVVSLARGAGVQYLDLANSHTEFRGWVQSWSVKPWGVGRRFTVRCWGPEKLLDWLIVPSLTIPFAPYPSGTFLQDAIFRVLATAQNAVGLAAPLTTRGRAGANGFAGTLGGEIAPFATIPTQSYTGKQHVFTNTTARQAIEELFTYAITSGDPFFYDPSIASTGYVTVDMDLAVRAFQSSTRPTDWADLTVTDTQVSSLRAEGLEHTTDAGDVPSGVYVAGGNAAGSGLVPAGDGRVGPIVTLNDSNITDVATRNAVATAYLAQRGAASASGPQRGQFDLLDWTPSSTGIHAGSFVNLTDTETGATGTYRIAQIDKTYTALRENWHVTYGGLRPSLPRLVRRLTRGVLQ